jgi:hypothetical protein
MRTILLWASCLLVWWGCKSPPPAETPSSTTDTAAVWIVVLLLGQGDTLPTAHLLHAAPVSGVKQVTQMLHHHQPMTGDWLCTLETDKGKILDSLFIVQPLLQRFEYPQDDGTIGSTVMELKENAATLHFPGQLNASILGLRYYKASDDVIKIASFSLPKN